MFGIGLSYLSGVFWRMFRILHVVPWIFGALVILGLRIFHLWNNINLENFLVVGGLFYFFAWIGAFESREFFP